MARKSGYRIGDLCRQLDLQPYVLRYWETEFPALQAPAGSSGQRLYTEEEMAIVRRIKSLLYEEGFTIAGAKKRLAAELEHARTLGRREEVVTLPQAAE